MSRKFSIFTIPEYLYEINLSSLTVKSIINIITSNIYDLNSLTNNIANAKSAFKRFNYGNENLDFNVKEKLLLLIFDLCKQKIDLIWDPISKQCFGGFINNRTLELFSLFNWKDLKDHIVDVLKSAEYNNQFHDEIYHGLKTLEDYFNLYIKAILNIVSDERSKKKLNVKSRIVMNSESFKFSTLSSRLNLILSNHSKVSDDGANFNSIQYIIYLEDSNENYKIPFEIWNQKNKS